MHGFYGLRLAQCLLSKRVTRTGAFWGMILGFFGCFVSKVWSNLAGVTLPAILDPVVIGIVLNVLGLVIGSALTQVSDDEKAARAKLFVIPEKEKNQADVKTTLKYMKFAPWLGVIVIIVLVVVWVLPLWR